MTEGGPRIADILQKKDIAPLTTTSEATLAQLSERMREAQIGAMIVCDDGKNVVGIISERDLAYGLAEHRENLHALPVAALMTTKVITCGPDDQMADVAQTMAERRIRHLPVVDGTKLIGIVSMRDVMAHRLAGVQRAAEMMGRAISD